MIAAYLQRIGYDGPREPTLALLRELHERHLKTVPFENLDIHWKRRIVADTARFLAKVVEERRGGFCYELNGAFAELLRALGFDVTLLSARVSTSAGGFGPPFDHMALLVKIGGERWLADVGFGDSFLLPLDLDARGTQQGRFEIVEGDEWAMRMDGVTQYLFTLEPRVLAEFAPMLDFQQSSPESSFTKKRVCTVATADGRITLSDAKLIVTRDGVREETPVTAEEWEGVLGERFGVFRRS
jgi:N-hydroxyarylamine O-acetyltransferase